MKGMIRTNAVYMKKLVEKQSVVVEEDVMEEFTFPLSTEADVEAVEEKLKEKALRRGLVSTSTKCKIHVLAMF